MFYDVAESELPHVDNSGTPDHYMLLDFTIGFAGWTKAMQYKIYPQCVNDNGTNKVVYYIAYHQDRGHNEFVVGPGKLDIFAANADQFAVAAGNFYGFTGQVSKHEVNYIKFQNKIFAGELGKALKVLKDSWLDALQDPNWVCQTLLAHAALVGGAKKLPGKKGPAITAAVEEAQRAGAAARLSEASGAVTIGEYGGADALRGSINISSMDDVSYNVQAINTTTEMGAPSVAKAGHREMLRQATETAKKYGKKSFYLVGEQANPNFVRHADGLAKEIGVPSSGKSLGSGGAGYQNYRVELLVDKVLDPGKSTAIGKVLGAAAAATAPEGKK
jgi:hypothetical protein